MLCVVTMHLLRSYTSIRFLLSTQTVIGAERKYLLTNVEIQVHIRIRTNNSIGPITTWRRAKL